MSLKKISDTVTHYTGISKPTYWLYGNIRSRLQPLISTDSNITKITDNLYISNISSAYNLKELKKLRITHIVQAILGARQPFPTEFEYLYVPLQDTTYQHIVKHFDECNKFIHDAIKKDGNVLVHCIEGRSRSATLLAAYIIYKANGDVNTEEAIQYLKNKRSQINPNPGFIHQLEKYYEEIKNKRDDKNKEDEKEKPNVSKTI